MWPVSSVDVEKLFDNRPKGSHVQTSLYVHCVCQLLGTFIFLQLTFAEWWRWWWQLLGYLLLFRCWCPISSIWIECDTNAANEFLIKLSRSCRNEYTIDSNRYENREHSLQFVISLILSSFHIRRVRPPANENGTKLKTFGFETSRNCCRPPHLERPSKTSHRPSFVYYDTCTVRRTDAQHH